MGLTVFEGHDVIASGVEIPGASGGFNKALAVNELELHHGDRIVLAVAVEVVKVRFDPIKDTQALQRVHVFTVDNVTPIDESAVSDALEAQRVRVEEAAGVKRLPLGEDEDVEGDEGGPDEVGE